MKRSFLNFSIAVLAAFSFLPSTMLGGTTKMNAARLYEHSAWWPPRAALTKPFTPPGMEHELPAGREGVLIRLEPGDPPTVLLDFGRHGLATLRAEQTDLLERAARIRSGETEKEFPNWSMMLGRGFVDASKGGNKVSLRDLLAYDHFLFIYLHDLETSAPELKTFLEESEAALGKSATLPVIFPVKDPVAMPEYAEKLQAARLDLVFMLPYLSDPYAASMHHAFEKPPHAVLTDTEGKSLYEPSEDTDWAEMLDELRHAVRDMADRAAPGP